ncbi:MAG: glycosyltransferase family 2 protein [Pseudomonadota bacterium]
MRFGITVVMVSYQTGPYLLDALKAAAVDPDITEIILVDNGNSSEDRKRLHHVAIELGRVRLLQGHGNVGFAKACNYGAALAQTTHLLFLNPDAVIEVGAAKAMQDAAQSLSSPWIAGGLIVDDHGNELRGSRRGVLNLRSALSAFTPLHRLPRMPKFNRQDEPLPSAPTPTPTTSGAMLMTDRASFLALGGFDEGYFLHVEDIALCRTARDLGGDVVIVSQARALHHGATSNVSNWMVEWHKLRGFLRYFWTDKSAMAPVKTILIAPLIAGAIFGRALWKSVKR